MFLTGVGADVLHVVLIVCVRVFGTGARKEGIGRMYVGGSLEELEEEEEEGIRIGGGFDNFDLSESDRRRSKWGEREESS